jgi:hypothetical protein
VKVWKLDFIQKHTCEETLSSKVTNRSDDELANSKWVDDVILLALLVDAVPSSKITWMPCLKLKACWCF